MVATVFVMAGFVTWPEHEFELMTIQPELSLEMASPASQFGAQVAELSGNVVHVAKPHADSVDQRSSCYGSAETAPIELAALGSGAMFFRSASLSFLYAYFRFSRGQPLSTEHLLSAIELLGAR